MEKPVYQETKGCAKDLRAQKDRISRITQYNQNFIEINQLASLSNNENVGSILTQHPDYMNHISGKFPDHD